MRRYWTILKLFWSTALSAEMEYRSNFVLACVTGVGHLAGSILAVWVFYRKQHLFGGYTYDQALLVMGFFVLLMGLANTVFRQNLSRIVHHVRTGTLDFILLKPIDTQFWLSLRNCSPWGLPNVLLGLGVIVYAGVRLDLGPVDYALGAAALTCGAVLLYAMWFMLGALSIWFVKVHNITHVLYQLLESGRYPVTAYGHLYQVFLTFVVPVAFLTTFPAEIMVGEQRFAQMMHLDHGTLLIAAAAIAALALLLARLFWRFALRFYTSASS